MSEQCMPITYCTRLPGSDRGQLLLHNAVNVVPHFKDKCRVVNEEKNHGNLQKYRFTQADSVLVLFAALQCFDG